MLKTFVQKIILFPKFKIAIESLRISEQLLGDKHAVKFSYSIPIKYMFNITLTKNLKYKDFNIYNIIDYLKLYKNKKIIFMYHKIKYKVILYQLNDIDYILFIWVNLDNI